MSPLMTGSKSLNHLVEAFAQTAQSIVDLARDCTEDDLAVPTECPGWTVHDQIAHVTGVEAWLSGHKDPRVEMPPYEHIRNELGKRVEYAVEVRRGRTGPELVAELETILAERLRTLRDSELTESSMIAGPFGPDQAATVLGYRIFDVWTHEQDIRCALGRPGDLDSPAAAVFVRSVMSLLPKLVTKVAAVRPGHLVVIEVTGPDSVVVARQGVLVEVDDQGRPRGRAMFDSDGPHSVSWYVPGEPAQASGQQPGRPTTISLSTEAFSRRAGGRRSVSDTEYGVVGDEAVAGRVLEALVVTH
jgi:uncharacterized protein (TIGR03083 family)